MNWYYFDISKQKQEVRFDKRSLSEAIKDEMLKKYEENVYLISQVFGHEPISSDEDDLPSDSDSEGENGLEEAMSDDYEFSKKILPAESREKLESLSKHREELEQAYQKIFTEQQSLERYQDEELDTFENSNKDFHQLFHELKQAKLKVNDIESYVKRAKGLGVFADTHPALSVIEGQSPRQAQRPFSETDHVDYAKLQLLLNVLKSIIGANEEQQQQIQMEDSSIEERKKLFKRIFVLVNYQSNDVADNP
eukprot:TRINITY_DN88461_c1_g1_i1.p2 TRINITY_DN88461_c1_g1~~TRINITY_DN88461_c1_g1_i1.p2  ORF type:complete len:251 (+),score=37.74 TRINITY_DN88461_c1_g1_i1:116-868(+)